MANVVRKAVAFYQAGHNLSETAKRVRHSRAAVYRWLKVAGVPMRPRGRPKGDETDYVTDVKRRLQHGESSADIAADYGVTRQAISFLAKYHGFPIRQLRRTGRSSQIGPRLTHL